MRGRVRGARKSRQSAVLNVAPIAVGKAAAARDARFAGMIVAGVAQDVGLRLNRAVIAARTIFVAAEPFDGALDARSRAFVAAPNPIIDAAQIFLKQLIGRQSRIIIAFAQKTHRPVAFRAAPNPRTPRHSAAQRQQQAAQSQRNPIRRRA